MGFRINTNIGAMNAHRNASMNNVGLDKSLNSLSSGLRINRAADDASGLAIANKLSAQSQGLGQAVKNSNDAVALIQTADGAMEEQLNISKRIRVLAVQSANDTQDTASRAFITNEVTELTAEYNQISTSTTFNDKVLLGGSTLAFHIGHRAADTKSVTMPNIAALVAPNVSTAVLSTAAITTMDTLIGVLNTGRSTLGAVQNSLESVVRNISTTQVNVSAAESNIRDVDFAQESATFAKHNILAQSGSYAMSQANAVQQNVLKLLQ
ncbi:flagellin [Candidatus Sulfurimonas marisnigri]|uniref:Flagellin n=1 Tax=Candidatus Sulfurimonas marisnigri TaxID=2740405 RepID=A0A7S7LZY4_9BACT|nr:flagellin [Candidatus Sulfurimonas marisnigri]QOY54561.1 flagellin [Candidatus Sulfurimonas marisnigri]